MHKIIPPIPPELVQPILDALEEGAPETSVAVALGVHFKTWLRLKLTDIRVSRAPGERRVRVDRALDRVRTRARALSYPPNRRPIA